MPVNPEAARPRGLKTPRDAAALPAEPNHPFCLTHAPGQYEVVQVDGKPRFVPALGRFPIIPGVAGVVTAPKGEGPDASLRHVRGDLHKRGVLLLEPSDEAEGLAFMAASACKGPVTKRSGEVFHLVFDSAEHVPGRRGVSWRRDHDAYNAWRRQLIDNGIVPAPHPQHAAAVLKEERDARGRAATRIKQDEVRAKRLAEHDQRIADIEAATKAEFDAPKTRSKKSAAA